MNPTLVVIFVVVLCKTARPIMIFYSSTDLPQFQVKFEIVSAFAFFGHLQLRLIKNRQHICWHTQCMRLVYGSFIYIYEQRRSRHLFNRLA